MMVRNETVLASLNQLTNWGFLTTDAHLKITSWSHWLETHSGLAADRVLHRNLLEVFPDLMTRKLHVYYQQTLQGRVVVLAQQLHKYLLPMAPSIDGTNLAHMQQSVRLAPLVEDGHIVGTLTVIEDVTERVVSETEVALQSRQQAAVGMLGQLGLAGGDLKLFIDRLASIVAETLEADFAAVLQIPGAGKETLLRSTYGWDEGQTANVIEVLVQSQRELASQSGEPVILSDDSIFRSRLRPLGVRGGILLPILLGTTSRGVVGVFSRTERDFSAINGHFLQAVAHVLALTMERNRLESELRAHVEELADGHRRKDEFLAMLAHELRNPLAPIRNALHLVRLLSQEPANELEHAYDIIERQIENLVRLVDDLLDVSRITTGKIQLRLEWVDLTTIISRAVEGARPLIDGRRHTLALIIPSEPIWVHADSMRLAQVLWNLLNNAAKYTPEGGGITLTVRRHEGVEISVRDTGMGIPPAMLPRIFDLFTQMERTLERAEGGLGIGLTLARRLTEMHKGTIEVFSAGPGRGSEFVLRLPSLSQTLPLPVPEKVRTDQSVPASGHRILVVDDNRDSAESLAMLLKFYDNEVQTVHDGILALETAAVFRPDVVLLDIGLPGLDGLEVCRRLRTLYIGMQPLIVAMTGYGQEEDRLRSEQAGFNAHMVKPVDLESLQELLRRGPANYNLAEQ